MPGPLHYWAHGLSAYHGARYNGEQVDIGKVFPLAGAINDSKLVDLGYLVPVPDYVKLVTCSVCDARFLDESSWNRHATKRHGPEARAIPDVVDRSPQSYPDAATAGTLERPLSPVRTRSTRQRGRLKGSTYHKREKLPEQLKKVYWDYYDTHDEEVPSMAIVAQGLKPPVDERTLRNYLYDWPEIQYPPPR